MFSKTNLNNLRFTSLAATPAARSLARWRSDMQQCLPVAAQQWLLRRQSPTLIVRPREADALLLRELGGERDTLAVLDPGADAPLSTLLPKPRNGWREVVIELPVAQVLERPLRLPVQVKDNLRQVMGYELDRLTPFSASAVYFDATMADTRKTTGQLDSRLVLCRRDDADPWLDRLRRMGAPPSRLAWVGSWPGANLLPPEQRPRRRRLGWLINTALSLLVIGLASAVLVTPVRQKEDQLLALSKTLRNARAEAEQVPDIRAELERARAGSVAVLERKAGQARIIDLLRELTDRLPEHTWVQTINIQNDEVDVRGESGAATELLGLLSQTQGVSEVTFRSPVMQISSSGKERFHIAFRYQRPDS